MHADVMARLQRTAMANADDAALLVGEYIRRGEMGKALAIVFKWEGLFRFHVHSGTITRESLRSLTDYAKRTSFPYVGMSLCNLWRNVTPPHHAGSPSPVQGYVDALMVSKGATWLMWLRCAVRCEVQRWSTRIEVESDGIEMQFAYLPRVNESAWCRIMDSGAVEHSECFDTSKLPLVT